MNLQMFGQLENVKENMIRTAKECFESANTVNLKLSLFNNFKYNLFSCKYHHLLGL